jgi:hypothetical protein
LIFPENPLRLVTLIVVMFDVELSITPIEAGLGTIEKPGTGGACTMKVPTMEG